MSDYKNRRTIFNAIQKERGSTVLSYITGDRRQLEMQISPDVIDIFVGHLDAIGPTKKLSLLLHTNGGDIAVAWRLINLLHMFCDELEVIIPVKALSAGTLLSMGADRIVMTKQAALGPIDPNINNPLNPVVPDMPHVKVTVSVEAVRGYLNAAKELGIADSAGFAQVLVDLSNKVHPLVLGQIFRSGPQIRFLAKKLLKRQIGNRKTINKIVDFLCAESGSHDYTINRREAAELGLRVEKPSDELYKCLRRLHLSYVSEFKLSEPYDPCSLLGQNQTVDYILPRGAIESIKSGSHQFLSEGTLTKITTQQMGPMGTISQDSIKDNRKFEGWRKQ